MSRIVCILQQPIPIIQLPFLVLRWRLVNGNGTYWVNVRANAIILTSASSLFSFVSNTELHQFTAATASFPDAGGFPLPTKPPYI